MPKIEPVIEAGFKYGVSNKFNNRIDRSARTCARAFRFVVPFVAVSFFLVSSLPAKADNLPFSNGVELPGILEIAVFVGAMSFALMSAIGMIQQRRSMQKQIRSLRLSVSDLRASNDRNRLLAEVPGQKLVVWNGADDKPEILGQLKHAAGVPDQEDKFLAFGSWLETGAATEFKTALDELRSSAIPFAISLQTRKNGLVEAVGTATGSVAYVRFSDLKGKTEELAQLKVQHDSLKNAFDRAETLLQLLPMPVWLRDHDDNLAWVNKAYSDAVDSEGPTAAVNDNSHLFDREERTTIQNSKDVGKLFHDRLPAIVSSDRKMLDVFNVWSQSGSAGMAIDRSEIDSIERTLKETVSGHSMMLDQLATPVAIFDKSQYLVFCNAGFQKLWNLDQAFLDTNPSNAQLLDMLRDGGLLPTHPDWKKWRDGQLEIYKALEPCEEWWHLLDGQTLRVVVSPNAQGGATWVFENVTERLALESDYNALMRIQGETLDHLNEAVAVFGSDGKLKLFNPALESLWQTENLVVEEGLHVSRVVEQWSAAINNPAEMQTVLGKITGFEDSRNNALGRIQLKDGSAWNYAVVPLPKGQSMLTMTNVTDSVNMETALQERAEALEASDLLKSNFIQHVSYELRAPLTSISGFSELLEIGATGELNEKQHEYVRHITSASNSLRSLVDDILDLASIDAGRMRLELEPVPLGESVIQVQEMLKTELHRKGIDVRCDIASGAELVNVDRQRLQQIIYHVMANAIRFSPDGGEISVTGDQTGSQYNIRIMDNGPGIGPDERDKIFDRFEARSATGSRHGAGLGLSLVKGLIELHGGNVTIEDSNGKGTCVLMCLPQEDKGDGRNRNFAA